MADLDLSEFLKDASIADLDWLDVDEVKYREQDHLPKQNLDIKPDLEALWAREGESPTKYVVPNKGAIPLLDGLKPRTMGDLRGVNLRGQADEIIRIARLALTQSTDLNRVGDQLVKRFGLETLKQHREVLAGVLQERGLVGNLYVEAADFPTCDQGKVAPAFVAKYAKTARYVKAKTACGDCCHKQTTASGNDRCGQFHKEIVIDVPYTEELARTVEAEQAGRGRVVQASGADPKQRIRAAYLAQTSDRSEQYEGQGLNKQAKPSVTPAAAREQLIQASSLVRKKQATEQLALDAKPVVEFLHREMVKGLSHDELASSLKLAFDKNLLVRTNTHWGPVLQESGLYGVVYTKQASFDDCHTGADYLAKHNPGVRAIVAGTKCGSCIYNKRMCMLYGKPLVKSASEVVTQDTVDAVILEHRTAGRLPYTSGKTASSWGDTPAAALKAIHNATRQASQVQVAAPRMGFLRGFHGNVVGYKAAAMTERQVVKKASQYMNEGLYGNDLLEALSKSFEKRDLLAASASLKPILAEQGLQGIFYVDPTAYDDYGKGCNEAARLHSARTVEYVKIGSKCGSCIHHVQNGVCSKIGKKLAAEPPYVDKKAQQREILASGNASEISYASLVNNGASMMDEYNMQNDITIDIKAVEAPRDVTVLFGAGKIKL
jgi:hypothetical protein